MLLCLLVFLLSIQLVTGVSDPAKEEIWMLRKECKRISGRLEKIKDARSAGLQ